MAKKGSITVFLALMLSLMMSLICASIESVRMAAARTQILSGLDIGLYSLFGQYDKEVFDDYDLFMIDGSCGGGTLKMSNVYQNMESYMKTVLRQNSQKLSITQGGFTGYQLITDGDGEVFYQQVVQFMKDTLVAQGVQLLISNLQERQSKTETARQKGTEVENGTSLDSYDSAIETAAQQSKAKEEELKAQEEARKAQGEANGEVNVEGTSTLQTTKPKQTVTNPITTIRRIMKMGILKLAIPSGGTLSDRTVDKTTLLSGRTRQSGMLLSDNVISDDSLVSKEYFTAFLQEKLSNYREPAKEGLAYQLEYIIGGKDNDQDNLETVAKELLLIREGVNMAFLMADSTKRAEAYSLASMISSSFLVPPAASVIEKVLLLCWAFAESVVDVRALFDGDKVSLEKKGDNWQVSLDKLPELLSNLDSVRKKDAEGLSYEDYLFVLLSLKSKSNLLERGMDMFEEAVRCSTGRKNFQLDSGIVAIEVSVDVKANNRNTYTVTKKYSYN
jgi:hypothetical protein